MDLTDGNVTEEVGECENERISDNFFVKALDFHANTDHVTGGIQPHASKAEDC